VNDVTVVKEAVMRSDNCNELYTHYREAIYTMGYIIILQMRLIGYLFDVKMEHLLNGMFQLLTHNTLASYVQTCITCHNSMMIDNVFFLYNSKQNTILKTETQPTALL